MKANDLIENQHRLVEKLFDQFEGADDDEKGEVFDQIARNLVGHDAIEREIFYPACEEELGKDEDILGESLVEHGVVEFCLFRADRNRNGKDFEKYVTVLKEIVMHHVKEEEDELLPKAEKKLDEERLEELGERMQVRFDQAMKSDFRRPLRDNLDQVLAGRTKTSKRPTRAAAKKRSAPSTVTRRGRRARAAARTSSKSIPRTTQPRASRKSR